MHTDTPAHGSAYMVYGVAAAAMVIGGSIIQAVTPLAIGLIISEVTCIVLPAMFYRRAFNFDWWGFSSQRRWPIAALPTAALILGAVLVGILANLLVGVTIHVIPSLEQTQAQYQTQMKALLNPEQTWLAIAGAISVTVSAPFCEEFLFRGTLLRVQVKHLPVATAIALNGLMFGVIHFNPMSTVPLSIVGAFFAWITWRTRSLWPAVACHAALNAVNGVILPRLAGFDAAPEMLPISDLLTGVGIVGALFVAVVALLDRKLPAPEKNR